jgi:hypothetical protein
VGEGPIGRGILKMDCQVLWFVSNILQEIYLNNPFLGVQPGDGVRAGGRKGPQIIKLLINDQGYPVLPSWEAINCQSLEYKKLLIGKFMNEMYCK